MDITPYPDWTSFETALKPFLDTDSDLNPRLLIPAPGRWRQVTLEDIDLSRRLFTAYEQEALGSTPPEERILRNFNDAVRRNALFFWEDGSAVNSAI